ncbi:hypothetical protein [Metabacillus fastidiosus]|uniref:hypothetical protein n=1 Tax=Metabacillus fastidiosus TaxID=1458 RepID=UPI003D27AB9C
MKITKQELDTSVTSELDKIGLLSQEVNNVKVWTGIGDQWKLPQYSLDNLRETGSYFAFDNYNGDVSNPHKFPWTDPRTPDNNRFFIQVFENNKDVVGSTFIEQIAYGMDGLTGTYSNIYKRSTNSTGVFAYPWKKMNGVPNINDGLFPAIFYVDGTLGTDIPNNGATSGAGAFKTIQYAIGQVVKKLSLHRITISVASGIYDEDVDLQVALGHQISLYGTLPTTTVRSINAINLDRLAISNFKVNGVVSVFDVPDFSLREMSFSLSTTRSSIEIQNSRGVIDGLSISLNSSTSGALSISEASQVLVKNYVGSSNNIGIRCSGSICHRANVTVSATTPTKVENGGTII